MTYMDSNPGGNEVNIAAHAVKQCVPSWDAFLIS